MKIKTYNLKVKDTLLFSTETENEPIAFYKKFSESEKTLYKVRISIDGKDLPFVKRVKYTLHKTFRNPVKTIERSSKNPDCGFYIWTWGIFKIKVEIEDINGRIIELYHNLNYGNEIKNSKISWSHVK